MIRAVATIAVVGCASAFVGPAWRGEGPLRGPEASERGGASGATESHAATEPIKMNAGEAGLPEDSALAFANIAPAGEQDRHVLAANAARGRINRTVQAADGLDDRGTARDAHALPAGATAGGAEAASPVGATASEGNLPRRRSRPGEASPAPNAGIGGASLKSLWPLGVTLAGIGLAVAAARRWMPMRPGMSGGGVIEILARRSFSARAGLCLVRLGDGLVLLGLTPNRIEALAQIRDPDEVSRILARAQRGRAESFSSAFRKLTGQAPSAPAQDDARPAGDSFPIERIQGADRAVRGLVARVRDLTRSDDRAETPGVTGVVGSA